jgi:hypothetical protein
MIKKNRKENHYCKVRIRVMTILREIAMTVEVVKLKEL